MLITVVTAGWQRVVLNTLFSQEVKKKNDSTLLTSPICTIVLSTQWHIYRHVLRVWWNTGPVAPHYKPHAQYEPHIIYHTFYSTLLSLLIDYTLLKDHLTNINGEHYLISCLTASYPPVTKRTEAQTIVIAAPRPTLSLVRNFGGAWKSLWQIPSVCWRQLTMLSTCERQEMLTAELTTSPLHSGRQYSGTDSSVQHVVWFTPPVSSTATSHRFNMSINTLTLTVCSLTHLLTHYIQANFRCPALDLRLTSDHLCG